LAKKTATEPRTNIEAEEDVVLNEEDVENGEPDDDDLTNLNTGEEEIVPTKARRSPKPTPDPEEVDEDTLPDEDTFAPYIVHEEQEWTLASALQDTANGESVYLFDLENERWFKLQPIKVGEISQ